MLFSYLFYIFGHLVFQKLDIVEPSNTNDLFFGRDLPSSLAYVDPSEAYRWGNKSA